MERVFKHLVLWGVGGYLIMYDIQFALLKQRQLEEYKFSNSADHWKSRKRA